jgi:hypothetical protein
MPVHLRVDLPDRPGVLAHLTKALAGAGADVLSVQVTERSAGRAVDDFLLAWPQRDDLDALVRAVGALPGHRILGTRWVRTVPGEHPAVDLMAHVVAQPHRAIETLVDLLPTLAGADWSTVTHRLALARPLYSTVGTIIPLPPLPGQNRRPVTFSLADGFAVAVPLEQSDLVLFAARAQGPPFLQRELTEVARVVGLVTALVRTLAHTSPVPMSSLTARLLPDRIAG